MLQRGEHPPGCSGTPGPPGPEGGRRAGLFRYRRAEKPAIDWAVSPGLRPSCLVKHLPGWPGAPNRPGWKRWGVHLFPLREPVLPGLQKQERPASPSVQSGPLERLGIAVSWALIRVSMMSWRFLLG